MMLDSSIFISNDTTANLGVPVIALGSATAFLPIEGEQVGANMHMGGE